MANLVFHKFDSQLETINWSSYFLSIFGYLGFLYFTTFKFNLERHGLKHLTLVKCEFEATVSGQSLDVQVTKFCHNEN